MSNQQEKNKKVRVNIKARLIDKKTQQEHKDYEVILDTTNLVIQNLNDLENYRLPLKLKINPRGNADSDELDRRVSTNTNKSYGTGLDTQPETSTAFTALNMSQNTKFINESIGSEIYKEEDPAPKRTIAHVSIQEHPNTSEYLMDNQSADPSSIFQSDILDENMGSVPIQNHSTPAASQYYDPNAQVAQARMKRFVFKIPAISPGDINKKVVRTKITFNLKNLLKRSVFGSDEIGRKFVNFSGSDVQTLKKVSKHENILPSDEIFAENDDGGTNEESIMIEQIPENESPETPQLENLTGHGTDAHTPFQESVNTDVVIPEIKLPESPFVSLTDIAFPELESKESFVQLPADDTDSNEIEKHETEILSTEKLQLGPSQSKLALFGSSRSFDDDMQSKEQVEEKSSQMMSDKIATVQSSLLRLGEALEHSLKAIAETKFQAVSMESTGMDSEEKEEFVVSHEKRPSVSFMRDNLPPQFHSTPIQSRDTEIDVTDLSRIVGVEDAAIVESIIQVAQIWKNLKDKIIAERQHNVKSYDNILTENELVCTFAGIVKEIIGMPSEMKAALLMKEKFTKSSSDSLRQQIQSTETLNTSNASIEGDKYEDDLDVKSLRRISKDLQKAIERDSQLNTRCHRSSTKSTLNLLRPSEDSFFGNLDSNDSNPKPDVTKSNEKHRISLSDSQLKILADNIAESLRSRRSFTMSDAPSNVSTRSSRMEKNLHELKQNITEMKNKMQKLSSLPYDTYEHEVIVTHEDLVDDLELPEQLIANNMEQARRIVSELEQRNLLHNSEELDNNVGKQHNNDNDP